MRRADDRDRESGECEQPSVWHRALALTSHAGLREDHDRYAARGTLDIGILVRMRHAAGGRQHLSSRQIVTLARDDDADPAFEAGEIFTRGGQIRSSTER